MTHKLDADDYFIHCVQRRCAEFRLNFFLIEPIWAEAFLNFLKTGQATVRVLLNMHSEHHQPEDVFHRIVKAADERGVAVIDPPGKAIAAFDKARMHRRLVEAGIPVPPTLIVPGAELSQFRLTAVHRELLGHPFVIKPGMGYGRRGVILDAVGEQDLLRSATAWPGGDYLLQRRIVPRDFGGEPAYFRVFYVFGSVWFTWWNCYTDRYRMLGAEEAVKYSLKPLEQIVRQIAELSGMRFFSSEIALTEKGEFVVIDYVNDQCHMLSQTSAPQMGVPDELVAAVAERLVGAARELIQGGR